MGQFVFNSKFDQF